MVKTRADMRKGVYKHLIEEILGLTMDSPIPKALDIERAESIPGIVSLRETDFLALRYKFVDNEANEHMLPLAKGEQRLLSIIPSFILFKRSKGEKINEADWINVTADEFQEYRASPDFIDMRTGVTGIAPGIPPTGPPTFQRTRDPVYEFKRGIKRDPSQFPVLKDDKQWDTWHQDTRAQARSQYIMEVLMPTYKPSTLDNIALFDEKQKFMYAVFMKMIQTDTGKSFVRADEIKYDAQTIYKQLVNHSSTSTKATMDSTAIRSYITSVRLGDGKWRGSSSGFVLNWVNQIRKYEAIVPTADHFSDGQKRSMLENAVASIADLQAIKTQADQHATHTGTHLTFDQYLALLFSAATTYDSTFTTRPNQKGNTRQVYNHDSYGNDDYTIDINASDFNDIDNLCIEINQAFRGNNNRNNNPRLSLQQWQQLTPATQTTWDLLDDAAKHTILDKQSNPKHDNNKPRPPPSGTTSANLHNISAYDYITANLHDSSIGGDSNVNDDNDGTNMQSDDDTTMLEQLQLQANKTKISTKTPPAGDISWLLSSKMSKTSTKTRITPRHLTPRIKTKLLLTELSTNSATPRGLSTPYRHTDVPRKAPLSITDVAEAFVETIHGLSAHMTVLLKYKVSTTTE
jgi:hypothetical protein